MKAFLSILMPVWNSSSTLEECIESILSQTYTNFEVIIVDDGSQDETLNILLKYRKKDSRLKIFPLGKQGIVAALNFGFRQSKGSYIVRMDADDRMKRNRLKVQLDFMTEYPECDLIGSRIKLFRDSEEITPGMKKYQEWSNSLVEDEAIKREIFVESPIFHPTFFVKRAIYEQLNGYRNHPWVEDYDFLLRAYQAEITFGKTQEYLVEKRDHPNHLYQTDPRCKRKAMFQAKIHYFLQTNFIQEKKGMILFGSGPSGRQVARQLLERKIPIVYFVDPSPPLPGRKIQGIPVLSYEEDCHEDFYQRYRNHYFLLCVGDPQGTENVVGKLENAGFRQGRDFMRFV